MVHFEQHRLCGKRWAASADMWNFKQSSKKREKTNPLDYTNYGKGLEAQFRAPVVCLTSGERRVQLLVEEPLLPVLLLLSDIALCWINHAQRGAD